MTEELLPLSTQEKRVPGYLLTALMNLHLAVAELEVAPCEKHNPDLKEYVSWLEKALDAVKCVLEE